MVEKILSSHTPKDCLTHHMGGAYPGLETYKSRPQVLQPDLIFSSVCANKKQNTLRISIVRYISSCF